MLGPRRFLSRRSLKFMKTDGKIHRRAWRNPRNPLAAPLFSRIGRWIEFLKLTGAGPESGWLKYYGGGKRLAVRTEANDLRVMLTRRRVVGAKAMGAIGEQADVEGAFESGPPSFVEPEERPGGEVDESTWL